MPKLKKPLRNKERKTPKGKRQPFGPFPAGSNKPEARPVRPKVPGTRDRNVVQRQQDIDQKASSRFLHNAALKRKGKKPQSGKTKPKARSAKPKPRSKRRGA